MERIRSFIKRIRDNALNPSELELKILHIISESKEIRSYDICVQLGADGESGFDVIGAIHIGLHDLVEKELIIFREIDWHDNYGKRRMYSITEKGRRALHDQTIQPD